MNSITTKRTAALLGGAALVAVVAVGAFVGGSAASHTGDTGATVGLEDATDDPFVKCVNGTSRAMVACGYSPRPTSVSLAEQETDDMTVDIRAVELENGGFVAVHRSSFVDGDVLGSLVGTSDYLDEGLHKNVKVDLDTSVASDTQLLAVVYKDTDGDQSFDFVSSQGDEDRPYTMTYTEAEGNVTVEAGNVVGDFEGIAREEVSVSVAGRYDQDGDGIDLSELQTAIDDFINDRIDTAELQSVIQEFISTGQRRRSTR